MTRAIKASELGLEPHFKVRVVLPNAILHLASRSEPVIVEGLHGIARVDADWINDAEYGDTVGFMDWPEVKAVTWRWSA